MMIHKMENVGVMIEALIDINKDSKRWANKQENIIREYLELHGFTDYTKQVAMKVYKCKNEWEKIIADAHKI